jgi:pilus assembly protein Flp/PilA
MLNLYMNLCAKIRSLMVREEGQGMVEYAMIIGLVAVGVILVLTLLGTQIQTIFTSITNALQSIGTTSP